MAALLSEVVTISPSSVVTIDAIERISPVAGLDMITTPPLALIVSIAVLSSSSTCAWRARSSVK